MPKKSQQQFLSHVELVNHVVATLARIHSQNEIHKNVIARMARAHTSSGGSQNGVLLSASSIEMPPPPDRPPHGANLLGNDNNDRKMKHQYGTNARITPRTSFFEFTRTSFFEFTILTGRKNAARQSMPS
jgi:hypothetical protein